MLIDPDTLPYQTNYRSLNTPSRVVLVAGTAVMAGLNLTHHAVFPWAMVFAPVIILVSVMAAYNLIRNAVHEGMRMADADAYLDDQVLASAERDRTMKLTPERLSAAMGEMG